MLVRINKLQRQSEAGKVREVQQFAAAVAARRERARGARGISNRLGQSQRGQSIELSAQQSKRQLLAAASPQHNAAVRSLASSAPFLAR